MVYLPDNAPKRFLDRETLWNEVEEIEKRKDARLAREIEIALPREFGLGQQIELVESYVKNQFIDRGMCADVAIHKADFAEPNPHAHILLTTRDVSEHGFELKNTDWNRKEMLIEWRQSWEQEQNLALENEGLEMRVDCRTLQEQGIDREPQIHLGVKCHHAEMAEYQRIQQLNLTRDIEHQLEYKPITERGFEYKRINELNLARQELKRNLNMQHKLELQQERSLELKQEQKRNFEYKQTIEQLMQKMNTQELAHKLTQEVMREFEHRNNHTMERTQEPVIEQKQEQKLEHSLEEERGLKNELKHEQEPVIERKLEQECELKPERDIDQEQSHELSRAEKMLQEMQNRIERENTQHSQEQKQEQSLGMSIEPTLEEEKKQEQEIEPVREIKFEQNPEQELDRVAQLVEEMNREREIEHERDIDFLDFEEPQQKQEQELTELQKREIELKQKIEELTPKCDDYLSRSMSGLSQYEFDLNKINEQKQGLRELGWSEERINKIENTFDLQHTYYDELFKQRELEQEHDYDFTYDHEQELEQARDILRDYGFDDWDIDNMEEDELLYQKEQIEQEMEMGPEMGW